MTWIAPAIARADTPRIAGERQMYQAWLDFHRQTLLMKCTGLTAEQLKLRSAEPSALTLLGLVRHMADVERWWFRMASAGEQLDYLYSTDERPDADFDDIADADPQQDFDIFGEETKLCDAAVAGLGLEHTFTHPRRGMEIGLRWVYTHMIEEYARHNGHADILRERIDGSAGS